MDILSVEWHLLEHARGSAADLPPLLRDLGDEDSVVRNSALDALRASLAPDGLRYNASVAAVPFLISLLWHPWVDRPALLDFLGLIAAGRDAGWWLGGCPPAGRSSHLRGLGRRAWLAVHAQVQWVLPWLVDGDPRVRCSAAHLLAVLGTETTRLDEPMQDAISSEYDDEALASEILALCYLGGSLEILRDLPAVGVVDAAVAVARMHLGDPTSSLERVLREAPRVGPWGDLALIVAAHLPGMLAGRPALVVRLCVVRDDLWNRRLAAALRKEGLPSRLNELRAFLG